MQGTILQPKTHSHISPRQAKARALPPPPCVHQPQRMLLRPGLLRTAGLLQRLSVRTHLSRRSLPTDPTLSTLSSSSSSGDESELSAAPSPELPKDDDREALKRTLVREALKEGNLGLSFSAGGFLYTYHLGVMWELAKLGILPPPGDPKAMKMAGSSAGSLAIATYACGLDVDKATNALFELAANCRENGTRGRLGLVLRDFLHAYLPDDAHERCRDLTYVYVTKVFPVWQPEVVHRFHDKSDLVNALCTSCHIPMYFNGHWMTKFRGRYYMDGGVGAFIPEVPHTQTSVKVCCFPVSEMLAKVQPSLEGYPKVSALLDVSVAPDKFESWPTTYRQLLQWALVPAPDEELQYLIDKGRKDARAWATSLQLVDAPQGVSVEDTSRGVEFGAPRTDGEGVQVESTQAEGSTTVADSSQLAMAQSKGASSTQ